MPVNTSSNYAAATRRGLMRKPKMMPSDEKPMKSKVPAMPKMGGPMPKGKKGKKKRGMPDDVKMLMGAKA